MSFSLSGHERMREIVTNLKRKKIQQSKRKSKRKWVREKKRERERERERGVEISRQNFISCFLATEKL